MIRIPDCRPADERYVRRAPAPWRWPVLARLQLPA
jgi:hypothetical protein